MCRRSQISTFSRPDFNLEGVTPDDVPVAVKMFSSAAWVFDVAEGDGVIVAGMVKDHEMYNGMRQTVLKRPKLVSSNTP